jgi:hypothetical protein
MNITGMQRLDTVSSAPRPSAAGFGGVQQVEVLP